MTDAAWTAVLDELEGELAVLERGGSDGVPAAWAPPALGGLPDALRPRARDLLDRLRACEARLRTERDAIAAELNGVSTRRSAAQAYGDTD